MDQPAGFAGSSTASSSLPPIVQDWRQRAAPRTAGKQRLSGSSSNIKETVIEIKELTPPQSTHWPLPRTPTAGESLKRWPQEPTRITNEPKVESILLLFDVVLCVIPIALIVKACLCVWGDYIDRDHKGASIDQASQLTVKLVDFNGQLTTLFTIIFIVIISTALRRFALWKAEKGATIGQLEQLQASMSLAGTLKAIWSLRAFTVTSLGLISLWAWYYVGSQASSREYKYADSGSFSKQPIAFLGAQAVSPFESGSIATTSPVRLTDMTARYHMFNQFTAGSQSNSTTDAKTINGADIFGNSLTPWYGPALDQTWQKLDYKHGWMQIEHMSSQPVVSSIGPSLYRMVNESHFFEQATDAWIPAKMIGDFTYSTAYFQANCSAPKIISGNNTAPEGLGFAISTSFNITVSNTTSPPTSQLNFWHWVNDTTSLTSTCSLSRNSVSIKATCNAATCKPHAIRLDNTNTSTIFSNSNFSTSFFDSMLLACGRPTKRGDFTTFDNDNGVVALRTALQAPSAPATASAAIQNLVTSSQFPLSMSITRFINTYYTSSQMLQYEHDFQTALATNGSIALSSNPDFTFTTIKGAKYEPQYILSWPWIIADIVSNAILLTAALFAIYLRRHTLAPDIFGFVSSLTRDNPHFQLPEGGSTLSGIDRARRMKHVKVKIGDVGSHKGGDVGRVGVVYAGEGALSPAMGVGVRDLERGKIYY